MWHKEQYPEFSFSYKNSKTETIQKLMLMPYFSWLLGAVTLHVFLRLFLTTSRLFCGEIHSPLKASLCGTVL